MSNDKYWYVRCTDVLNKAPVLLTEWNPGDKCRKETIFFFNLVYLWSGWVRRNQDKHTQLIIDLETHSITANMFWAVENKQLDNHEVLRNPLGWVNCVCLQVESSVIITLWLSLYSVFLVRGRFTPSPQVDDAVNQKSRGTASQPKVRVLGQVNCPWSGWDPELNHSPATAECEGDVHVKVLLIGERNHGQRSIKRFPCAQLWAKYSGTWRKTYRYLENRQKPPQTVGQSKPLP